MSLLALKTFLPNKSPKFSPFYFPGISKNHLNTCLITFKRPVSVLNLPTSLQNVCHALGGSSNTHPSLQVEWAWNSGSSDHHSREPLPSELLIRIDSLRKKAAGSSMCQSMFQKFVFIKDWIVLPQSLVQMLWHVRKPPDPGLKWVKTFWQTLHSIGNTPIPEWDFKTSTAFPTAPQSRKVLPHLPQIPRKSPGAPLPKKLGTRPPHVWASKESPALVFRLWRSLSTSAMQGGCTELAMACVNKGISLHFQKELH